MVIRQRKAPTDEKQQQLDVQKQFRRLVLTIFMTVLLVIGSISYFFDIDFNNPWFKYITMSISFLVPIGMVLRMFKFKLDRAKRLRLLRLAIGLCIVALMMAMGAK